MSSPYEIAAQIVRDGGLVGRHGTTRKALAMARAIVEIDKAVGPRHPVPYSDRTRRIQAILDGTTERGA